ARPDAKGRRPLVGAGSRRCGRRARDHGPAGWRRLGGPAGTPRHDGRVRRPLWIGARSMSDVTRTRHPAVSISEVPPSLEPRMMKSPILTSFLRAVPLLVFAGVLAAQASALDPLTRLREVLPVGVADR